MPRRKKTNTQTNTQTTEQTNEWVKTQESLPDENRLFIAEKHIGGVIHRGLAVRIGNHVKWSNSGFITPLDEIVRFKYE